MITEENFLDFCREKYINPHCLSEEEFTQDLKTLKYIKSYFRRYITGQEIKATLLLNNFIYLHNCFGDSLVEILFSDFEDYYYDLLKTVLYHMNLLPKIVEFNSRKIYINELNYDYNLLKILKTSNHSFNAQ